MNKIDPRVVAGVKPSHPSILDQIEFQKYYVDVKEFGAKGDGVTDDSVAFQSAISFAEQGCRRIIASGRFVVSLDLSCNDMLFEGNATLVSNGKFLLNLRGNGNRINGWKFEEGTARITPALVTVSGNDNVVSKVTIYNTKKSTSATVDYRRMFYFEGMRNILQHSEIYNGCCGVSVTNFNNKVMNCNIHDNIVGIRLSASARLCEVAHNIISKNNVNSDSGADGILASRNVSKIWIHHNEISESGEHGIYFQGDNSHIENNMVLNNNRSGIKLASYNDQLYFYPFETVPADYIPKNIHIKNNTCLGNAKMGDATSNGGIYLQSPLDTVIVEGNTCNDSNGYGIRSVFTDTTSRYILDSIKLTGNTAVDNVAQDISIAATRNSVVKRNRCNSLSLYARGGTLDTDGNQYPIVSENTVDGVMIISRTLRATIENNMVDSIRVSNNCEETVLKKNLIRNQQTDFDLSRIAVFDENQLTLLLGARCTVANSNRMKSFCRNTIVGDALAADYLVDITTSYTQNGLKVSDNIIQSNTTFALIRLSGAGLTLTGNKFTSLSDRVVDWNVSKGLISGNHFSNGAETGGIVLKSAYTGNLITNNFAKVTGTLTGNTLANNL